MDQYSTRYPVNALRTDDAKRIKGAGSLLKAFIHLSVGSYDAVMKTTRGLLITQATTVPDALNPKPSALNPVKLPDPQP